MPINEASSPIRSDMTCSLRLKLVLARIQHGATVSASQETIQVGMAEAGGGISRRSPLHLAMNM